LKGGEKLKSRNRRVFAWYIIFCFVFSLVFFDTEAMAASMNFERLCGKDRFETAGEISRVGWPKGSAYAVIVREDSFVDALCAGPLAKKYNAPILFTQGDEAGEALLNKVRDLKVTDAIIIGGTSVISEGVEAQLKDAGVPRINRIYGRDRFETSVEIAKAIGRSRNVILTAGANFPDAVSITTVAVKTGMPILLTEPENLPGVVEDFMDERQVEKTYIIGGKRAIGTTVEAFVPNPTRLGGKDRYETNIEVIKAFESEFNYNNIFIANGYGLSERDYVDAVAAAALAARTSSPIVIIEDNMQEVT